MLGKRFSWIFAIALLPLFYTHCSGGFHSDTATESALASFSESDCPKVSDPLLGDLKSIDDAVKLVNALPKPLTVDCFIINLKRPLKVFAVDNKFSAQPSAGINSPRIFIISNNLTISVVPAGIGKDNIEFSEITSLNTSIKGDLLFPIDQQLASDVPYNRILEKPVGTQCRICHQNETRALHITTGEAYYSNLLSPDPFKRVSQSYLKTQAINCDLSTDEFRCKILRSIFLDGAAKDGVFPIEPL